ncbi:MAG: hypothetical protein ACLS63_04520 [Flavonifractor plautii]
MAVRASSIFVAFIAIQPGGDEPAAHPALDGGQIPVPGGGWFLCPRKAHQKYGLYPALRPLLIG